jgi:hypothetical protein
MSLRRYTATALAAVTAFIALVTVGCVSARADLSEFTVVGEIAVGTGDREEGIGIDESTDDVYVYDGEGTISKFDAEGSPVNFSALGSNAITGVGGYGFGETELAVDNSDGPAKGDIYLAGGPHVQIFSPAGIRLGEISQTSGQPWGEVACGVAVDGSGNVYVGLYPSNVDEYTPTGNPVTNNDYVGSHGGFNEICEIAADHGGSIYAASWTPDRNGGSVVKLDSFQAGGIKLLYGNSGGTVTVANSASAEVFISEKGEIRQYGPSGNLLSTFGSGVSYETLAMNAKNGRLYSFDQGLYKKVQIWQGVVTPQVRTTEVTNVNPDGSVTLTGSINPEGASVETCSFQYGLTAGYGVDTPCAQGTPMAGTSVLPVSADVSGLTLNHPYHYRLATTDSHGPVNGSDQTFTILVRPTVEDQQPSSSAITRSTARLSGTVDPEQGNTRYHFEYGTGEDYGERTSVGITGDLISGDIPFTQEVVGLMPDTVYHYRLVATNVAGTTFGADHTFTSGKATPPGVLTGGATNVAQNTATIEGTVDTNGLPSSYGFEIATGTDYGPPTGLGYIGAGSDEAVASLQLTGLVPGTTYHYRLTSSSVDGTVYGADRTFTTSVFANTFAEPPAPLPFVSVPSIVFPSEPKSQVVKKKAKAKSKVKKRRKAKGKKKPKSKKK